MDRDGNFYFVTTRSYGQTLSTIYRTRFRDGAVDPPELVQGVSLQMPGWVNFDAEISADGNTLYFVDGYFGTAGHAQNANLVVAARSGNGFQRLDDSARIFANVNSDWLEYAPDISADQLELFFTRVEAITPTAQPLIYRSTRRSTDQPFSEPKRVGTIQAVAEAAALSPDEQSFYYHALVDGRFRLRLVRRLPQAPRRRAR